ncbi:MAG: hypothetical protein KUG77_26555, partial [Nannocystaceae bacterium]|nr:hypothetical protein [Nannocystaceae bacterium]
MSRLPAVLALLLFGCTSPLVPESAGSSGEAETTTGAHSTSEVGPSPTTAPADTTATTTRGSSDSGSTSLTPGSSGSSGDETDTSMSSGFILDPDGGGGCGGFCPANGVMAHCSLCSYFDQDCGAGHVCKPVDICGADTWSKPACRPAPEDATAQAGEPCMVEESPYSGIDTCAPTSMCFDVDPLTLEGTCAPYCSDFVTCEDTTQTCFEANDGWVPVCLSRCS